MDIKLSAIQRFQPLTAAMFAPSLEPRPMVRFFHFRDSAQTLGFFKKRSSAGGLDVAKIWPSTDLLCYFDACR